MKKSTITDAMVEMILRGDQKAEIFAELLQIFGVKYQHLISQIMHFEYDFLREKFDPKRAIRRDILDLLDSCETKAEIYQKLFQKYGEKNDTLITTVLEKDYEALKKGDKEEESVLHSINEMDYTVFFNLNEKLKVPNKQRDNYRVIKEFSYKGKTLVGEVEIKHGKLFIGAYSYEENLLLTILNFITVINAVFKDYFVLTLSNLLAEEKIVPPEEDLALDFNTSIRNKKILLNCIPNTQTGNSQKQYLLDIFYTIDSEMLSMTIITEDYQEAS